MSALWFYTMMWYALPLRSEFFAYQQSTHNMQNRPIQSFWSRIHPPSELMGKYIALVQKWQWIWKYIPGVQSVYLSNKITFNAVDQQTSIDFFVVTLPERVRTTRILVISFIFLIQLREKKRGNKIRFCTDFFVTQECQDLWGMLLTPSDPYLVYRLAHLVPLYHYDFVYADSIYEENEWLQYYLPSFPWHQTIFLWIDILIGGWIIKRFGNRLLTSWCGVLWEYISKNFSLLFIYRKKYRKKSSALSVLIKTGWYKSWEDKRKRYALQWELFKKTQKNTKEVRG